MKRTLLTIICSIALLAAHAQMHYTVEAGYAMTANFSPSPGLRQPLHGAQIDAAIDYRFRSFPLLGIKAGVGYKFVGYYSTSRHILVYAPVADGDKESVIDHSVFVPARMTVNFDVRDWTFKLLTGPKLSYHWANTSYRAANYIYPTGQSNLSDVYVPFDCSWGVGFGCSYGHLYMEAMYDMGLYNRTQPYHGSYDMNTFSSRELSVAIGYTF